MVLHFRNTPPILRGMESLLNPCSTARLAGLVGAHKGHHGSTKAFIAKTAGMHRVALEELLSGKRRLTRHYACKLAPVLGVSAEYLLGDED